MLYNPFIPRGKSNIAIIAGNAHKDMINSLEKLNIKVIPTIKCDEVHQSIAYHPDIAVHPISHDTLIVAPNVYDYYKESLWGENLKLIKGEKRLSLKYPGNIAYNVGRIYGKAIHNLRYTDEVLKYYLEKENIEFININQGYSKCSMAIIDEESIITADYPLYIKLKKLGYNPLLISPGEIILEGQNYGFIGGTSGNLSKNTMVFSGKLDKHPDKEKIESYIFKRKKRIIYLSNRSIEDIGSILTFNTN